MKLFKCQACGQLLHFENTTCGKCSRQLGYVPRLNTLTALDASSGGLWRALADGWSYRFCANAAHDVCNWLIEDSSPEQYCVACRHNRTIPDISQQSNLIAWRKIESAKHRLFYSLVVLRLPLSGGDGKGRKLAFDFLAAPVRSSGPKVMTGHENGLITIALSEADDAERERQRTLMHEPYRTLLGHFRHEVGHYFWDVLVRDGGKFDSFRKIFGDERQDYGEALQRHYVEGAPSDWQEQFVTPYAASHPWEDFAECWAHYLHIVDALEMAAAYGLQVHPDLDSMGGLNVDITLDPYNAAISDLVGTWRPLSIALNSLNRTMGLGDLYPFVLAPIVITKLEYICDLIRNCCRPEARRA
jgi:hypothetical protein